MAQFVCLKRFNLSAKLLAIVVCGLFSPSFVMSRVATAATPLPSLAVLPFEIDDNSGEIDPPERHAAMLDQLTQDVAHELSVAKLYTVIPSSEVGKAVSAENPGTFLRECNGCELDIGKRVGAQRVLIGWVFKMSTLIGTLHIVIKDVATGGIVYTRAFDFRGDNPRAWDRASKIFVQELGSARRGS